MYVAVVSLVMRHRPVDLFQDEELRRLVAHSRFEAVENIHG
jgi:hypothetical protein